MYIFCLAAALVPGRSDLAPFYEQALAIKGFFGDGNILHRMHGQVILGKMNEQIAAGLDAGVFPGFIGCKYHQSLLGTCEGHVQEVQVVDISLLHLAEIIGGKKGVGQFPGIFHGHLFQLIKRRSRGFAPEYVCFAVVVVKFPVAERHNHHPELQSLALVDGHHPDGILALVHREGKLVLVLIPPCQESRGASPFGAAELHQLVHKSHEVWRGCRLCIEGKDFDELLGHGHQRKLPDARYIGCKFFGQVRFQAGTAACTQQFIGRQSRFFLFVPGMHQSGEVDFVVGKSQVTQGGNEQVHGGRLIQIQVLVGNEIKVVGFTPDFPPTLLTQYPGDLVPLEFAPHQYSDITQTKTLVEQRSDGGRQVFQHGIHVCTLFLFHAPEFHKAPGILARGGNQLAFPAV